MKREIKLKVGDGAGWTAQWLRASDTLSESLSLIPSTHIRSTQPPVTPASGDPPPLAPGDNGLTCIPQMDTYVHNF